MKKIAVFIVSAGLLSLATACVVSQERPSYQGRTDYYERNSFHGRIDNQQKRIDQGIASGELTRHEAGILQDNLNNISKRYEKMKSDGILTSKEQEKLEKKLDENSEMLYSKKHNKKHDIRKLY
ncbi:MAG: hypothetical protein A2X59_12970 [Nitrospirae bacterium GWC2_42_7]|nr:MAG: hypothetical protein A2X59_12970 [Nitrospirae bacterium GWC2_42_7]